MAYSIYTYIYIDRVSTVVVRKTSQHFLSNSFVRNKKQKKEKKEKKNKVLNCMKLEYYK